MEKTKYEQKIYLFNNWTKQKQLIQIQTKKTEYLQQPKKANKQKLSSKNYMWKRDQVKYNSIYYQNYIVLFVYSLEVRINRLR